MEKRIDDFLTYLELARNRSPLTISNYRFYLHRFCTIMHIAEPRQITTDAIKEYRLLLNRWQDKKGTPLSKNTQNYHLIAVRSLLKFLAKEDTPSLAPEKVELMRLPERQVSFLDTEDVEKLLAQPYATKQHRIVQLRDVALLETLFSTGLRVSELVSLRRNQFNPRQEELSVRGKGGKVRVVFLSSSARESIAAYLGVRHDNALHLFVRHDRAAGKDITEDALPITPRSVERLIARYALLAGITKKVSPHTMRHSYATDLLANGADLRSVQSLLGHASITTTQIYTHVTNKQLKEVHRAFHARRRKE